MKNEKEQKSREEKAMTKSTLQEKKDFNILDEIAKLKKKFDDGIQKIDNIYDLSVEALNKWNDEETKKIDDELVKIKEKHSPDIIDVSWEEKKAEILKSLEENRKRNLLEEQKLQDEINQLQQKADSMLKGNKK